MKSRTRGDVKKHAQMWGTGPSPPTLAVFHSRRFPTLAHIAASNTGAIYAWSRSVQGAQAMQSRRLIVLLAPLTLAAACGQGSNGLARPNTMLDASAHDPFFPIALGSAHAI